MVLALWGTALLAQAPLVEIRVLDGEGAVHLSGSRAAGPVVQVVDELGRPVAGAIVSFRLPDDGPGGAFPSGLSSEIVTTGADGRASAPPVRWNRLAGPVQIRVTAVKNQLRAGTLIQQYLSDTAPAGSARVRSATAAQPRARMGRRARWIVVGAVVAGAAGFAAGWASRRNGPATAAQPAASAGVDIGTPTITIGTP